jgi:hypothetical protein
MQKFNIKKEIGCNNEWKGGGALSSLFITPMGLSYCLQYKIKINK